ncbi:hypothetical protein B2A_00255, partial [mine drainage metagenome]
WNLGQNVSLESLVKVEGLLGKLPKDPELTVIARRVETLMKAFEEYREALSVGRDVTGSDGGVSSVAAEKERGQVEEVLARWEAVAEATDDEVVRQGIRQMREAWERRKRNLYVEVRDLHGKVRAIELTNWRSEQGHREVRLSIRGRTRKARTEQEMTRHGALMAVVFNWVGKGMPERWGGRGWTSSGRWERCQRRSWRGRGSSKAGPSGVARM